MKIAIGLTRLFIRNSQVRIQREMEYRANYITGVSISIINAIIPAVFQYFIFTQTKGFPGWTLYQIILFQGVLLLALGIRNTMFGEIREVVDELVGNGNFDRILLKPYPPIGTIMASGFSIQHTGTFLTGVVLVIYSALKLGISIGIGQLLLLILSLICGLIFFASLNIIYCSVMVMIIHMGGIWDMFQNILSIAQYPKEIFPKLAQTVFVAIAPFMIIAYFPTRILLGNVDMTLIYAFISSLIFLFGSIVLWNRCLKKYTSAGG